MDGDQGKNGQSQKDEDYFANKWWGQGNAPDDKKGGNTALVREPSRASNNDETAMLLTPVSPVEKVRTILSHAPSSASYDKALQEQFLSSLEDHALFCQLDVLCHFENGQTGWKEAARWLKYEEKVESGDRWSKPHVPTASLHSMFELRKAIAQDDAAIILDVDPSSDKLPASSGKTFDKDQSGVAYDKRQYVKKLYKDQAVVAGTLETVIQQVVNTLVTEKRLPESQSSAVFDILTKPHKHKHRTGTKSGAKDENSNSKMGDQNQGIESYPKGVTPQDLKEYKPNKKLMKKISPGAEAVNILVGEVNFLTQPIICMIRLSSSAVLSDITEVAVPTRFMFVILQTEDNSDGLLDLVEMGRAAASLFTDKVFTEVSYSATCRQDILDGMDEYIDELTVLPPSIWDPSNRLEPPDQAMSIDKIKRRLNDDARRVPPPEAFHFGESAVEDPTLARTGRLFGGLIQDIKRRYPLYWSDIKDGLSLQCFATIVFLYFACITPIVTFGGLLGIATENYMGTMETLVSGSICGLIYALFAGQPLSIVGATGPLLVFESIVYQVCQSYELDFLSFRFWTGMWSFVMLMLLVAFDLSSLVKYITRFTEESFAVLISLIFMIEAFLKCYHINDEYPVHRSTIREAEDYTCHCEKYNTSSAVTEATVLTTAAFTNDSSPGSKNLTSSVSENCITYLGRIIVSYACISEEDCTSHDGWRLVGYACGNPKVTESVPDVFFFSCFLFLGTFGIALTIKDFKNSSFFPTIVRNTFSDFAVFTAIMICTGMDIFMGINTPKLLVPAEFRTTRSDRNWVVDPFQLKPIWLIGLTIIPAFLATILIFLDQQITAVIVNRKEHKLKKGHGYHLDAFVLAFSIAICSLLGLPWFVAATVRAITHVRSLIVESDVRAPGEKIQMLGVREQRVTGICIHLLIGVSVLATGILKFVPMPVLYGVFLYMGWTSLRGVQFVDRILIMFMPSKYQPDLIYLRHVPSKKVHIFTVIQIICMVGMWFVKSVKMIAILFPLLILGLCFVRKAMDYYFTQSDLFWLDHLLPDKDRREKEDKAKDKLSQMNSSTEKVPMDGEWDEMTVKRDYGIGVKERRRKISEGIITGAKLTHSKEELPSEQV